MSPGKSSSNKIINYDKQEAALGKQHMRAASTVAVSFPYNKKDLFPVSLMYIFVVAPG